MSMYLWLWIWFFSSVPNNSNTLWSIILWFLLTLGLELIFWLGLYCGYYNYKQVWGLFILIAKGSHISPFAVCALFGACSVYFWIVFVSFFWLSLGAWAYVLSVFLKYLHGKDQPELEVTHEVLIFVIIGWGILFFCGWGVFCICALL